MQVIEIVQWSFLMYIFDLEKKTFFKKQVDNDFERRCCQELFLVKLYAHETRYLVIDRPVSHDYIDNTSKQEIASLHMRRRQQASVT